MPWRQLDYALKVPYPVVQECLIETIREEMRPYYTEPLDMAWKQALGYITTAMANWQAPVPK